MRALITTLLLLAPALAHAEVTPAALPAVQVGGLSTSTAITVTEERRLVGFQFSTNGNGLFQIGLASAIDDLRGESGFQANIAAGFRIPVLNQKLGDAGRLRLGLVGRGVAEGAVTLIGDSEGGGRVSVDGGISAWLSAPSGSSGGVLVGAGHPFVGGDMTGTEIQVSGMIVMALDEPEVSSPARQAAAVEELLTTDPRKWPEGGPRPPSPDTDERTYLSVGLLLATGYHDDMTPDRLMLTVGVTYP